MMNSVYCRVDDGVDHGQKYDQNHRCLYRVVSLLSPARQCPFLSFLCSRSIQMKSTRTGMKKISITASAHRGMAIFLFLARYPE